MGHHTTTLLTVRQALTRATAQLATSPTLQADAARDATLLLLHALGITRAALLANPDRPLTDAQQSAYARFIARRLTHEPIQYTTGEQEFYGLTLQVTPAVLIPRPETEHLVEAVLFELGPDSAATPGASSREASRTAQSLLDIGTGSGAIAIALASHLPHLIVTAVDISPAALEVAAANAARHNLTDRIHFVQSDLLGALAHEAAFDVIVSNPPYVAATDRESLHPQVRDFEPATALFAGDDGLSIYRRLVPAARAALKPNGLLALEIGHGQRDPLVELLSGWNAVRFIDDLQRIPRVALARRP